MTMRIFVDPEGKEWQAFDVVPRIEERRSYDRRMARAAYPDADDRRGEDRRVTVGRRSPLSGISAGWLCFERVSGTERRRLSPIPADWRKCNEATLEGYRRSAREVLVGSMTLGEFVGRGRG